MKEENPVDHMRFYEKSKPDKAIKLTKEEVSYFTGLYMTRWAGVSLHLSLYMGLVIGFA